MNSQSNPSSTESRDDDLPTFDPPDSAAIVLAAPRRRRKYFATVETLEDRTLLAAAVAFGDFNGDGFDDLATGVSNTTVNGAENAGRVHVIYATADDLRSLGIQSFVQDNPETGDGFGSTLAVGDFNFDRFDDLAIGVPGKAGEAGLVQVLYGSAAGLTLAGRQFWHQDVDGLNSNAEFGDRFGSALAIGDFNEDQFDDLAIGVPGEDVTRLFVSRSDAGAVNVIYGTNQGLTPDKSQVLTQDTGNLQGTVETGDRFGAALAVGDFDGNKFDDLAIGVPGEDLEDDIGGLFHRVNDAGAVNVIHGGRIAGSDFEGLRFDPMRFTQNSFGTVGTEAESGDQYGAALAAGDFDGNGNDDVVVGVPRKSLFDFRFAGEVNIRLSTFAGRRNGTTRVLQQNADGIADDIGNNERFGRALAVGDFDDDGIDDLVIGVPLKVLDGAQSGGAIHVIYGQPMFGSSGQPYRGEFWHQNVAGIAGVADAIDRFGMALAAGRAGGDTFSDLAIGVRDGEVGAANVIYGAGPGVLRNDPGGLNAVGNQLWLFDDEGANREAPLGALAIEIANAPRDAAPDVDGNMADNEWTGVLPLNFVSGERVVATTDDDSSTDTQFFIATGPSSLPFIEQDNLFALIEYEGRTDRHFEEGAFIADVIVPTAQESQPGLPSPSEPPPTPMPPPPDPPMLPPPNLPDLGGRPITIQIRGTGEVFNEDSEEDERQPNFTAVVDLDGDGIGDVTAEDLGIQVGVGFTPGTAGDDDVGLPGHLLVEVSLPLALAPGFADPDGPLNPNGQTGIYAPEAGFWNVLLAPDPVPGTPSDGGAIVQAAAALVSISPNGETTANADDIPQQIVDVDFRPFNDRNQIRLRGHGILPVAILSTADFDATTIVPESVRLRNPADTAQAAAAVFTIFVDIDRDGDLDLLALFRNDDLAESGAVTATSTSVVLTAETTDGGSVAGTDVIDVLPARPANHVQQHPDPIHLFFEWYGVRIWESIESSIWRRFFDR